MSQLLFDGNKAVDMDLLAGDAGWMTLGNNDLPLAMDIRHYYEYVGLLFQCTHIRAKSLSKVPWVITDSGDKTIWESGTAPPPSLLWLKPLPKLLRKTEAALTLAAQAYWHIERNRVKPTALVWLAPIATAPYWDAYLGLTHFVRNVGHGMQTIPVEDMVYLRYEHPLHETLRDRSPGEAAARAAGVLYNVDQFVIRFFERGAIKATLLTVKGNPPKTEMDRIKNWWKRFFQGVQNAFGAEVLNAEGITPVVVGEGISELSNTDLTEEKRNDIAITLGVPLSMVFSDAANYATSQQDEQNFYNSTIVPDCELIAEQFNEQMLDDMGLHLQFKPEAMNIFQEDEKAKAQSFATYVNAGVKRSVAAEIIRLALPETMTYEDLDAEAPAVQEPTIPMTPATGAPPVDPSQGNLPAKATDPAYQSEQRRFKAWARKRPDADPTDFHSRLLSEADKAALLEEMGGGAGQPFFTLTGPITPDAYAAYKAMVLQLEPGDDSDAEQRAKEQVERKFGRDLADAFDEQLQTILPAGASDDQVRAAAHQVAATSEPVREVLRRSLEQGSSLGTTIAFDTLQNAGMSFDWTLAHSQAAKWASQYSYDLVQGINTTSQARVQTAVDDWFKERTTLPDLVKELTPTFGKQRAKLIAQTETTRAAREGGQAGYEQSGVVEETEWVTVNDERVCPVCGPLDGKRAPLRGTYEGGMTQPAHPGCRCFERPVITEPKTEPKPSQVDEGAMPQAQEAAQPQRQPPPPFANGKEAAQWAEANLKTKLENMSKAEVSIAQAVIEVVDNLERITGEPIPATVTFGGVKRNAYAQYDPKTAKVLFKTRVDKPVQIAMQEDNATWRALHRTEIPFHATDTDTGMAYHEIGHAIDDSNHRFYSMMIHGLPLAEKRQLLQLSGYAGEDMYATEWPAAEAWAESFAAVLDGSDRAKLLPDSVVELVWQSLGRK